MDVIYDGGLPRNGGSSRAADDEYIASQNFAFFANRIRVLNTLCGLEQKLVDCKEQLAVWQKTASDDVKRIAKMQEIIKNLEQTLGCSPVYQAILSRRNQQVK